MTIDKANPDLQHFSHQAMGTTFEIMAIDPRCAYCRQAANEAFRLLDLLEQQLSRFIPNSDIGRINSAAPGQEVCVGQWTVRCLIESMRLWHATSGAFDITLSRMMGQFRIDEDHFCITRLTEQVQLDLGAIGKGFALDRMAEVLSDWGIKTALLHAGSSTVLAMDGAWPLSVSCPFEKAVLSMIELNHAAISCSSQVRSEHIIDPVSSRPTRNAIAAWVLAPTATAADALSTAMLVAGPVDAARFLQDLGVKAGFVVCLDNGNCKGHCIGDWPGHACECDLERSSV